MSRSPNLLVIVLDQLRYDCLGAASGGAVATPTLDGLASRGVSFEQAFTHFPVCCPARQSLLCGTRPETFGGLWNYDVALPVQGLSSDAWTWTAALARRGYQSAHVGKWHVNPAAGPTEFGYDRDVSEASYRAFRQERYPAVVSPSGREAYFGYLDPVPLADTEAHWLIRQAIGQLREFDRDPSKPWHLRIDLNQPHLPCCPVTEFAGRYRPGTIKPWGSFAETFRDKPYIQRQQLVNWDVETWTWDDWAPVVARYLAVITQTDNAIGTLLAELEESGQSTDTVVVVTTDHGDLCGAHRMLDKHYVLYDDLLRVPLIVSWPGRFVAGVRRQELVYNLLDLVPTFVELFGLDAPANLVGRSVLPLLTSTAAPSDWRHEVVATYNGQQFGLYTQRAIRTAEWKYVWNATDVDELYNLAEDPFELENRIRDRAAAGVLGDLRRRLLAILRAEGDRQMGSWVEPQLLQGKKI